MSQRRRPARLLALVVSASVLCTVQLARAQAPPTEADTRAALIAAQEQAKTGEVKPYAPVEAKGREIYGKQICWHCHSQFVRPVNEEDKRCGGHGGHSSHDTQSNKPFDKQE